MDKEVTKAFTENITEYFVQAQTVCTRPSSGEGGRGRGLGTRLSFTAVSNLFRSSFVSDSCVDNSIVID